MPELSEKTQFVREEILREERQFFETTRGGH